MRVLQAFKSSEMDAAIKLLDKNEVDTLMKYIYRGFAQSSDSASAILLAWHEKVGAFGKIKTYLVLYSCFPYSYVAVVHCNEQGLMSTHVCFCRLWLLVELDALCVF